MRNRRSDKIISLIVLSFILFNTMGYFILFEVRKSIVRREMAQMIAEKQAANVIIRIPDPESDPEFKRIHKKEFRYKDQMYDIVSETSDGRVTTFCCIHDKKEENLFKGLRHSAQNKMTLTIWETIIKYAFPVVNIDSPATCSLELTYPEIQPSWYSIIHKVLSPPPKGHPA